MSNQQKYVSGGIKVILRLENLIVLIISCFLYHHGHYSWGKFFLLFFLPDISFLGYLAGSKVGAIAYNTAHSYVLPLSVGVLSYLLNMDWVMPYFLIWAGHIGFDRALGYGLKYTSGFADTHLGKIGKENKKEILPTPSDL